MANIVEVLTHIEEDPTYLDQSDDPVYCAFRDEYYNAYVAEVSAGKRSALTRKFNKQEKENSERLRREWWLDVQATTGVKYHVELGDLTVPKLIECIGWLMEHSFEGKVGLYRQFRAALPYVVRDVNGDWRASQRWDADQWLWWACDDVSVFFSDSRDATIFKLTFG